jgi:hypothetical protein
MILDVRVVQLLQKVTCQEPLILFECVCGGQLTLSKISTSTIRCTRCLLSSQRKSKVSISQEKLYQFFTLGKDLKQGDSKNLGLALGSHLGPHSQIGPLLNL